MPNKIQYSKISLILGSFYYNPVQQPGLAGVTSRDFSEVFSKKAGNASLFGRLWAPQTYDAIWVIAQALNSTLTELDRNGRLTYPVVQPVRLPIK